MDIEINGVSITLTPEQIEEVAQHLVKKEHKMFPQEGEIYWRYDTDGRLVCGITPDSRGRVNVSRTKEEAEIARDIAFAKMRLEDAIKVANDGWYPDWEDCYSIKYSFMLDTESNIVLINDSRHYKMQPDLMHMKSRKIAEAILKEHKADIMLVLGE
jgi:hypothetical protein